VILAQILHTYALIIREITHAALPNNVYTFIHCSFDKFKVYTFIEHNLTQWQAT